LTERPGPLEPWATGLIYLPTITTSCTLRGGGEDKVGHQARGGGGATGGAGAQVRSGAEAEAEAGDEMRGRVSYCIAGELDSRIAGYPISG
jgi:hypothetical protein